MAQREQTRPNLYALLIGIDCYLPLNPSDKPNPMNLRGCVSDINRAEEFLRTRLGLAADHIRKLTATDVGESLPAEPPNQWPTRENIVNGFRWLDDATAPGDQIYMHYSGHGGRVKTPPRFLHFKWGGDMDEVLVPTDYSLTEDNFLRDFELAHILRGYVARQLNVTVVLDSCHSGGATRGEPDFGGLERKGVAVRTIDDVRDTLPPPRIPVANDAELAAACQGLAAKPTRDFQVGNAWQLEPEGYLLLAACRPSEFAYEQIFDGGGQSGALTYWLLDSLERLGADAPAKTLYDRVLAKVHSYFRQQTPQLQGMTDRSLFGPGTVSRPNWINVLQVAEAADEVELNVGQSQGVSRDARFAIYPCGETDFTCLERRRALATIKTLGATTSCATIVERFSAEAVQQGDRAVLLESGRPNVRRTLRLVPPVTSRAPQGLAAALQDVEHNITRRGGSFLQSATAGERADFLVSINDRGEFVVGDASGMPFPHLRPALNVGEVSAPFYLVERLVHLAKYLNVYELDNCDPFSPLRRSLSAELLGVQADYVMGDKPAPQPLASAPLKAGEWTFLKISNSSTQVLNVSVLDLRPNWSIGQLYPAGAAFYEPIDPGRSFELPLRASLPQGYDEGRDVLKVMGTVGPSNFRWLELPALDEPDKGRTGWRGSSATLLDEFLAAFMNVGTGFRDFTAEANASHEWTTMQVEIDVRGSDGKN